MDSYPHVLIRTGETKLFSLSHTELHVVGLVEGDNSNVAVVHIQTMPELIYSVPVELDGTFRPASVECLSSQ